jgi:O-Antigen ligase
LREKEEFVVIGDNGNLIPAEVSGRRTSFRVADPTKMAFFWLSAFFVIYCARPEDWIPGPIRYLPFAKITAILAMWGLFNAMGKTKRTLKDLPKEARILLIMIGLLYAGAFLSPIWIGGALNHTIDFSKLGVAWVLVFLLTTSFDRLRRIIFVQTSCVAVVCGIAIVKGHNQPRLEGVLSGIYSNPNDLAFAIVLTLPFVLAFMVTSKNAFVKVLWLCGMLLMMFALFLTASRAGFIDLVISGGVTLYYFAIKGKRLYLLVATALVGVVLLGSVGGKLYDRFVALSGDSATEQSAYGSYEQRKFLMVRALDGITHYPIFGVGVHNFSSYSGAWHDVHMTYLQICVEGGIAVLILYLMFFWRAFKNLKALRQRKNLDPGIVVFIGALHSSLIGFVVGACFAPEAYQYFPYFAVAFTAVLLRTVQEQEPVPDTTLVQPKKTRHFLEVYADRGTNHAVSPTRW